MLASSPASMVNQKRPDLGIPNRFKLTSSRFSLFQTGGPSYLAHLQWLRVSCFWIRRLTLLQDGKNRISRRGEMLVANERAVARRCSAGRSRSG
jgi:hypothetical protein